MARKIDANSPLMYLEIDFSGSLNCAVHLCCDKIHCFLENIFKIMLVVKVTDFISTIAT